MGHGPPSALLGKGPLQINVHKLVDHRLASQEEAEGANTGDMFWHLYVLYILYIPIFWKETTSHEAMRRDAPNIFFAVSHLASGWRSSHWTFQAPFRQCRISMFTFFYLFSGYICKAEGTGEAIFAALHYKCQGLQDLFFKTCLAFEWKCSWFVCVLFDTLYLQCKEQYFPLKGA